MVRFRRLYGESPLHLLALIASLLIAGAAIAGWFASFTGPTIVNVLVWFLGAIVAHDLFLVPLYSALDRIAFGRRSGRRLPAPAARPSGVAYVRIPAMLSALVFLVFFPEILRLGDHAFFSASGCVVSRAGGGVTARAGFTSACISCATCSRVVRCSCSPRWRTR